MQEPGDHQKPHRRRADIRGFVDLLLLPAFVVMAASGAALFLVPAVENHWWFAGLGRFEWLTLHLCFSAIFIVAGIAHLAFNWHAMVYHLRDRGSHRITLKREAAGALAVTVWLIVSAVFDLPPASSLREFGKGLRTAPTSEATTQTGSTGVSGPLPPGHPPTEPGEACSACHRR